MKRTKTKSRISPITVSLPPTRAARVEPVTLVGQVYCTPPLAAMLALENARDFDCDYVGKVRLAKDYGELALYRLSRRSGG